jgi:Na+-driven multidrug efflux pump
VLVLVLAPGMGAKGAAVANVGGEAVAGLLGVTFLIRVEDGLGFPWTTLGKVILAIAPAAALALIPGLPDVAVAVLATIVYAVLLLLLRAVPSELIDALPRR